jgi:hypothetical protein
MKNTFGDYSQRGWFYFKIRGASNCLMKIIIGNITIQENVFNKGLIPVYSENDWES